MAGALTSSVDSVDNETSVVNLQGRLDIASAADTKRLFASTVEGGSSKLIINLQDVTFIDSSGLSALVSGLRTSRQAGGDLRLAAAGEQPRAVMSLTSLDQVFQLYPTVSEALNGFAN